MKKKLIIASGNNGKLLEIEEILGKIFEIVPMKEIGFCENIEENGKSFLENAKIKAKTVFGFCKLPVLADDSGLCVSALDGAPGVFSARYFGKNATDEQNINKLLHEMSQKENRAAKFVCTIVFFDGKQTICGNGEVFGEILKQRQGSGGFGYDSVFFCPELNKTFAEASMEDKNKLSHRKMALEDLLTKLENV